MKHNFSILYFAFLLFILPACNKYLDVKPKGVVIPEKVDEYDKLLNSEALTRTAPVSLLYASDDLYQNYSTISISAEANAYFWKPQITANTELSPSVWGPLYSSIYSANVVIGNVMGATDGTDAVKVRLKNEALVMRAECFFTLLTAFAKAYNPSSAATDPGIPLISSIDVTEKVPGRASVGVVMDTIISNLITASESLPATAINKSRVNKYIAFGLLARVYLYKGDFSNAAVYAEKALEAPHSLQDYNEISSANELPIIDLDPEVLWYRLSADALAAPGGYLYSDDLISYFSNDDLRLTITALYTGEGYMAMGPDGWANFGISFPEMYLTKAEGLARNNKVSEAMDIVNLLRSKRISSASYTPLGSSDKEDALTKILDERRRELVFKGQRWMDMKRLDAEGRMPPVQRLRKPDGAVLATLAPRSPNYVFEIPARVLGFNPGMQPNFK